MHNLSDKDKKIWNFYTSNLNSIKKLDTSKEIDFNKITVISKILRPNSTFNLDDKIKKHLKKKRLSIDAIIDLHGKTEVQAYEIIKNFIKNSYLNSRKKILIITGKGTNNRGKLKLKTPLWLKSTELSKFIVGFETMPLNKGGEGALFVKLKNKNKYR